MKKYEMTVTNDNDWSLGPEQIAALQKVFEVSSLDQLLALNPGGDAEFSGEEVAKKYESLEKFLLPKLWLEVFTDNIENPDILFSKSPCFFKEGLDSKSEPFLKSRLLMVHMEGTSTKINFKMHLESKFIVEVHDDVDFTYDGENPDEVNEQIYECNRIANFGLNDIDLENDDDCNHDWDAELV